MNDSSPGPDRPAIRKVSIENACVCVHRNDARRSHFFSIWLRDNRGCKLCRVAQSGERLLYTADIPDDLGVSQVYLSDTGHLCITWSDGHSSLFDRDRRVEHDYSSIAQDAGNAPITL